MLCSNNVRNLLRNTLVSQDKLIWALFTTGILIFAVFPFSRWLVQRARDSGIGKTVCLSVIPLINLVVLIYLLSKKTTEAPSGLSNEPSNMSFE